MFADLNLDPVTQQPLFSKGRKTMRIRPIKAYRHFRNLIANKEDTEQVFHIIVSLNGKSLIRDFHRFLKTEKGQMRFQERNYLPPILDDRARWKALPEGTVGRAYVDFMEREGLSAQGLVDEYATFGDKEDKIVGLNEPIDWYTDRLRDTHDLCHIMTGYGRDALGEACVLGFSYSQNRGMGLLALSYMAGREIKKHVPKGAPVMAAVKQGRAIGSATQKLASEDIVALMAEPLEAARTRLGFSAPTEYVAVKNVLFEKGLDPIDTLVAA